MAQLFLSTVNAGTFTIDDLAGIQFTHPVNNYPLLKPDGNFEIHEINASADLQAQIVLGNIIVVDQQNNVVQDITQNAASDAYVKATVNDLTPGTLADKLVSSNISFTTLNPSGNEQLSLAVTLNANEVNYDGTAAGLTANQVQAAIDEVDGLVDSLDTRTTALEAVTHNAVTLNGGVATQDAADLTGQELTLNAATITAFGVMSPTDKSKLDGIEASATADQIASEVPYTNTTSGLTATNVQAALDEIDANIDGLSTSNHAELTLGAGATTQESLSLTGQQLSANAVTPTTFGVMSPTDKSKLDGIETAAKDDQIASEVPYTNTTSGLVATQVQAAIDEIDARIDANGRTKLATTTIFYVDVATGNDNNPGTIGAKFATITRALNYIGHELDLNGHKVFIDVTPGDYTAEGNLVFPTLVDSYSDFGFSGEIGSLVLRSTSTGAGIFDVVVSNILIKTSGVYAVQNVSMNNLQAFFGATVHLINVRLTPTTGSAILCRFDAAIYLAGDFSLTPSTAVALAFIASSIAIEPGSACNFILNGPATSIINAIAYSRINLSTGFTYSAGTITNLTGATVDSNNAFIELPTSVTSVVTFNQTGTLNTFNGRTYTTVDYNNAISGLTATTVKNAIDELANDAVLDREVTGLPFYFAGSNGVQNNSVYLANSAGAFTNQTPYIVARAGGIVGIVAYNRNNETVGWSAEVYVNGVLQDTTNVTPGNYKVASQLFSPIALAVGDEISMRFVNTNGAVTNPTILVHYFTNP